MVDYLEEEEIVRLGVSNIRLRNNQIQQLPQQPQYVNRVYTAQANPDTKKSAKRGIFRFFSKN